jgi:hypothetical protein
MISMAAALDYFDQHPTTYLGFSFWLQMIAWIISLLGAAIYACSGCNTCGNGVPAKQPVANGAPVRATNGSAPAATAAAPATRQS